MFPTSDEEQSTVVNGEQSPEILVDKSLKENDDEGARKEKIHDELSSDARTDIVFELEKLALSLNKKQRRLLQREYDRQGNRVHISTSRSCTSFFCFL